ncbi:MAG: RNA polymerase sigma factor RpoD/SigA [Nitrospinae bacterium]|nr:RNA polymerase sigma factor RpoD/SigA [Nitrospinota bacterium]
MSTNSENSGKSSGDPMSQYLRDISSLPMLTREEEIELARRVQKGDRDAFRKLVEGNLRFVVSVASKFSASSIALIDLVNEGNIGLIRAAEKFDPDRGVKFITYAVWWIRAAIQSALAKQSGVVGMPQKQRDVVYKIHQKEQELTKLLGRDPSRDEVAEAFRLTPEEIEVKLRAASLPLSLDDLISDEPSLNYLNTLEADFQVDEGLMAKDIRDAIESLVESLSSRERGIISMRFGLNGYDPMTLHEIGEIMKLSKERIRQIEAEALKELQETARNRDLEECLS